MTAPGTGTRIRAVPGSFPSRRCKNGTMDDFAMSIHSDSLTVVPMNIVLQCHLGQIFGRSRPQRPFYRNGSHMASTLSLSPLGTVFPRVEGQASTIFRFPLAPASRLRRNQHERTYVGVASMLRKSATAVHLVQISGSSRVCLMHIYTA